MIKLYGLARSRTYRCLWLLEELGVPYEREPISHRTGVHRTPEYLAINPNGRVPALQDGEVTLWESLAINLYLAEKHGGELWPATVAERGRTYQWTLWAATELEPHLLQALLHRMLLPEEQRKPERAERAEQALQQPLAVLEGALQGRDCLLGGGFTVADLNVAGVLAWAVRGKVALEAFPTVQAWLWRCLERPANQRVSEWVRSEG